MPDTPPRSHVQTTSNAPLTKDFDMMVDELIKDPAHKQAVKGKKQPRPLGRLTVRPTQQSSIPLGTYNRLHAPKGFCVEIDPDPDPDHSVVTRILSSGSPREYTLTLVAANFGNKTVTVTVRSL